MSDDAQDIEEQNATCSRCAKPIKRYGSDGFWFTDRYECIGAPFHLPTVVVVADYPNHRHATKAEERDWLAGHVTIEGAVETDAGLLVPDGT